MQFATELPLEAIRGLHMNDKQYVRAFFKEYIRRFRSPTVGDKRFQLAAWIIFGCLALSSLLFIATGSLALIWLLRGTLATFVLLMIADALWSFWDILRQVKANELETNPTTHPQAVIRSSGLSGMEQMRAVAMVSRWQYGLIALFLLGGLLVPVGWLKVVFWCLMEVSFL
jgi:hypothetical protein